MSEKIKILFAEDEKDVRESIAAVLESEGYEVLQAEGGNKALEIFLEQKPDLIISDIMMPEGSGYELLKAVREDKDVARSNIPFLLLSALGQKEDVLKGATLQASDYLFKPVDFDLLFAKIREKTIQNKKNKEVFQGNINNLKRQVANIVPHEMLQYVDMINQVSSALKSQVYGPLPHQKYIDDLNKIYLNSLKLKTIINNLFDGSSLSSQIDVEDEILSPRKIVEDFISTINKKFQMQISIEESNPGRIPNVKVNKQIICEIIKRLIGCILKIDDATKIKIVITSDHLKRVILIFYPTSKIDKNNFETQVKKSVIDNSLDKQGLTFEIIDNHQIIGAVLTIPDYRVISN